MKEELMKQLLPLLERTKEGLLGAADMLQKQAPVLCEQILRFESMKCILEIILGLILLVPTFIFIWMQIKSARSNDSFEFFDHPEVMFNLFLLIPIVLGCICFEKGFILVKILVAPKLYLVEYITALMK